MLILLAACTREPPPKEAVEADTAAACVPADESCNGLDDDCDGVTDESGSVEPWYWDADGDGFGGGTRSTACAPGEAWVQAGGDCADGAPSRHPGAAEACNGIDDDCDGEVDELVPGGTWYADADGDGYGDAAVISDACVAGEGWVDNYDDCDDTDDARHPDAEEACDGVDQDCDGVVDEDATGGVRWQDADGDGYGDPDHPTLDCDPGEGWVDNYGDCDDTDPARAEPMAEVCDDVDNDCDGLVDGRDDDLADGATWYADADGDGHGDPGAAEVSCGAPRDHVAGATDCDDGDAAVHPGATETCDAADEDCDGAVDDGASDGTWYADADGDGYGDATTAVAACDPGAGWVANGRDCDDADAGVTTCGDAADDGSVCAARWGSDDGQVPSWTGGCDTALGFQTDGTHCYYAVDSGASWDDARASCAAAGGHLATIGDAAEDAFVVGLTGRVWLGGCDDDVEGTWTWITGETWSYTNWVAGEPNDMGGTEECLETYSPSQWNDIWCTYNSYGQGYVCEFE